MSLWSAPTLFAWWTLIEQGIQHTPTFDHQLEFKSDCHFRAQVDNGTSTCQVFCKESVFLFFFGVACSRCKGVSHLYNLLPKSRRERKVDDENTGEEESAFLGLVQAFQERSGRPERTSFQRERRRERFSFFLSFFTHKNRTETEGTPLWVPRPEKKREREGRGATASGFLPGWGQPITRVEFLNRSGPCLSLSLSLSRLPFRPNALLYFCVYIFLAWDPESVCECECGYEAQFHSSARWIGCEVVAFKAQPVESD